MWIFTSDAFISIVAHREYKDHFMVRARAAGDIERVFGRVTVKHTPGADYAYRATLDRVFTMKAVATAMSAIDYPNFKDSVAEPDRHDAYLGVWTEMMAFQRKRNVDAARKAAAVVKKAPATKPKKTKKKVPA